MGPGTTRPDRLTLVEVGLPHSTQPKECHDDRKACHFDGERKTPSQSLPGG